MLCLQNLYTEKRCHKRGNEKKKELTIIGTRKSKIIIIIIIVLIQVIVVIIIKTIKISVQGEKKN